MSAFETTSAESPISGARLRLIEGLWRAAVVALALMPIGMAIAHRSSPLFLAVSTLLSLGAVVAEGKLRPILREAFSALASPLGMAVLAFFAWCLVSIAWSEVRGVSFRVFAEFWAAVIAVFVLGLTLARRINGLAFRLLAGAFVIACTMIMFELSTGLAFRQSLDVRAYAFIFNRSVLTLLILAVPLVAWIIGRRGQHYRTWSLGLVVLLAATALLSDSGAAKLGLFVAVPVFLSAWFAPRLTMGTIAAGLVVAMLAAPLAGVTGDRLLSASAHDMLAGGHSRERVKLWTSFGEAVRVNPIMGAGYGVSPRMRRISVAKQVPRQHRRMLAIGHPHNAALQIWVELGAVGIAIAIVVLLLILRAIARQPHPARSASLALLAGASAVALVGHGAWQGWWAASLGAAIIWIMAMNRMRPETR